MRFFVLAVITLTLAETGLVWGQHTMRQGPLDLKAPSPDTIVTKAAHCTGYFRLDFQDGKRLDIPEINLRLKVDTSPNGPAAGMMVKLRAGMTGDRASLVFASVADLKRLLREGCGN
jgi:cytochrome c